MTVRNRMARRMRAPLTAAAVALGMAGCAVTHVGEDWQCPVAQGVQCASVAAADPAVQHSATSETSETIRPPAPIWPDDVAHESCIPCVARSNPFTWFAGLFRRDAGGGEDQVLGVDAADTEAAASPPVAAEAAGAGQADAASPAALRSPERIARVWIAPFVDADGVYREGAWVRVVIAPAAWKLP